MREDNHDHPPREGDGDGCGHSSEEENNENQPKKIPSQEENCNNATENEERRIQTMVDGCYTRTIVRCRNQWEQIMSDYERLRGWEEGMDYDSYEEEEDANGRLVGPSMRDHGHLCPDEKDWRYETEYEDDTEMTREEFRRWKRPPFWLPCTDQDKYYSTSLIGLDTSKRKLQILWDTVRDLRFPDGRIAGFIENPIKSSILRIKQTITIVHNTMRKVNFNTNRLNLKVDTSKRPPKQKAKPWDMSKIMPQLNKLVLTTRYQVVIKGRYMRNSRDAVLQL